MADQGRLPSHSQTTPHNSIPSAIPYPPLHMAHRTGDSRASMNAYQLVEAGNMQATITITITIEPN